MRLFLFLFLFLTTLAFTCVSVSAQGWDGPVFHIVGNVGIFHYKFMINGTIYEDPDLTLIAGQTYQFSIDYNNDPATGAPHPFGFTSSNTNDVEAFGAIGNARCKTSDNAFMTTDPSNPCIVSYTANTNAFYRCAFHQDMNGKLIVITPTTATTTPPTPTPTPTPTPDPTIDNSTSSSSNITIFHVIGNNGTNSYIFNISGVAVENPSFDLVLGQTYQFSIDYINDPAVQINRKPHPFGFTTKAGPIVEPLGAIGNANCKTSINHTFITTDVLNPCIVTYVATVNTFYQCSIHPRMRGALIVTPTNSTNDNPPSSSPTNSPTTSSPTNNGTPSTFNGTIFHIIGSRGQASYIFNISGVAVENPSFDLVLGETYQFSIDYLNTNGIPHPFGFSRDGGETPSVEALGAIGNVNCQTSPPNAFVTTDVSKPCIITYVANVNTFYRCAYHPAMKGALTVIPTNSTNNNPPSSSPTTSTPTTSTPTNGTPSPFNGTIFHIIGSRASASYIFNVSGVAVENPSFDLILGKTYQFSIDYNNDPATGVPHPFGFSTNGGTAASIENIGAIGNVNCKIMDNAFITTNISKPCIITYTPKVNTFYRCSFHGPMKGALNVIGTAPSSTAGPTPTENPNCVAGVCVNTASSISTSIYLTIIASFIALAATAF